MSVAFQWSRNKRSGKHFSHTHLGVWVPVCRGGECWVTWSVIVWFCLAWLIVVDEKSGFPLVLAHSHVSLAHKSLVCNLNLTCTLKSWLVMCRWSCNVSIINNFSSMSTMKIQSVLSISFEVNGCTRQVGGRLLFERRRREPPRGVWGHAPPENFEI